MPTRNVRRGGTAVCCLLLGAAGCAPETAPVPPPAAAPSAPRTIGSVERLDPALDAVVPPGAVIEVIAEGFEWAEGPLWLPDREVLLFSDVPANRIYRWSEAEGHAVWLEPSGYTGEIPRGGEPGSNGLLLDRDGTLILCQHGDRRIARLEAPLDAPQPIFSTVADRVDGERFNSPNDIAQHSSGALYFTDPPYGLAGGPEDPSREIEFSGVYRIGPGGEVTLLTDELSRPNGLAFSPDERTLYVANSDPDHAVWMAYPVEDDGTLGDGEVFFDATRRVPRAAAPR